MFSAGFDLKVMMSGPAAARDLVLAGGEFFMELYEFPLPVVAAVSGHAIAGGVLLAASCDVRLGIAGDFKLGLGEQGGRRLKAAIENRQGIVRESSGNRRGIVGDIGPELAPQEWSQVMRQLP